jgi:hypothetical protein
MAESTMIVGNTYLVVIACICSQVQKQPQFHAMQEPKACDCIAKNKSKHVKT